MKRRSAWGPIGLALLATLAGASPVCAQQTEAASGASAVTTAATDHAPPEDYVTPRLMGLGLGGRAGVAGTSAAAANAANLPLMRLYHVETGIRFMPTQNAWSFGGAFADSVTSKLAAGVITQGIVGNGDRDYSGYDLRLALGLAASSRLGIGFSPRYLHLHSDRHSTTGQSLSDVAKGFTFDASIRVTLFEGFHVAALGYNLASLHSTLAPRLFGGGIAYSYKSKLDIGFDILADFTSSPSKTTLWLGGGIGYFASSTVPLRVGYAWDQFRSHHTLTASIGYVDPHYAIELAFRKSVAAPDTTLLLTFRFQVE